MSTIPTLPGIMSKMIDTPRIQMHVLFSGSEEGTPVLFIHGNASSATYWEEIMLKLPEGFRGLAPDLRGYGDTEDKLIDATCGVADWVSDLLGLLVRSRSKRLMLWVTQWVARSSLVSCPLRVTGF